jgi:hypothetical protein
MLLIKKHPLEKARLKLDSKNKWEGRRVAVPIFGMLDFHFYVPVSRNFAGNML